MKITAYRGTHCKKPGRIATVSLMGTPTAHGLLRLTLDVFLSDKGNFSISGLSRMNGREWGGGQIIDDLKMWRSFSRDVETCKAVDYILSVWEAFHLNDVKAGTPEQMAAVAHIPNRDWYDHACAHLKSIGLYEVELDGKPYKFGHKWLTHPIPESDLKKIQEFFFAGLE